MTANDALRMLQSEGIFYVLAAQFNALLSLAAVKAYAFQRLVFNRNVCDVRHTFGNKQALIMPFVSGTGISKSMPSKKPLACISHAIISPSW